MAVDTRNVIDIVGDSCALRIEATNVTHEDPIEFTSGAFRSSPEERRVCLVYFSTRGGDAPLSLRFEFTAPNFVEHNIMGRSLYPDLDRAL